MIFIISSTRRQIWAKQKTGRSAMTQKEKKVKNPQKTERTLRAGFNFYTATIKIPRSVKDEDVFRALSSKPNHGEF